jgi:anthranilate synthase
MAVEHDTLPIAAVQFHPESILTLDDDHGLQLLRNVMAKLVGSGDPRVSERASLIDMEQNTIRPEADVVGQA